MSSVDINRLKGNYAENIVAAWLGRVCLVRPVAAGTDIGVDLYCESVIEGTPFLHFWVQVKAIGQKHFVFQNDKITAWCDFDTSHLRYWLRQPVPVYAFLVPVDAWPPAEPNRVFTIRITEQLLRYGIPNQGQLRLKTSEWTDRDTIDEDLNVFVTQIVPWDSSALLLQKGIVTPIPKHHNSQYKSFPQEIGYQYLGNISNGIRDAAIIGLLNSLIAEKPFPNFYFLRKRFEAVAQIYENDLSPLGVAALFHAARVDKRFEIARQYVQDAIARVEADSKLCSTEKISCIAELNKLLDDLA